MASESGDATNTNADEVVVVHDGFYAVEKKVEEAQVEAISVVMAEDVELAASNVVPKLLGFDPRLVAMFFDLVKAESDSVPLNASTLLNLVRAAMELVEAKAVLSGSDKKRIVLHVVRAVVMRTEFDNPDAKQLCITMLDSGVVSAAIDLAATASKGHLALNMPVFNKKGGCACVVS